MMHRFGPLAATLLSALLSLSCGPTGCARPAEPMQTTATVGRPGGDTRLAVVERRDSVALPVKRSGWLGRGPGTVTPPGGGRAVPVPPGARVGAVIQLVAAHDLRAGDTLTVAVERDPGAIYADTSQVRHVRLDAALPPSPPMLRPVAVAGMVAAPGTGAGPALGVGIALPRLPLEPMLVALGDSYGPALGLTVRPIRRLRLGAVAGRPWDDLGAGQVHARLLVSYDL